MPVHADTFVVGGGTITTTQADTSSDLTGAGGPFKLQANTAADGDVVTVTGVSIANTNPGANGRALDVGLSLPSAGSYSVSVHGSTLQGEPSFASGGAGAWFSSTGGLVSFDSTGGAANIISGNQGLVVTNEGDNGSVAINTGADTITATHGEILYGVPQGTGTISIDTAGATLTGMGTYGIVGVDGAGRITIGGLNGGIASTINVASGYGSLPIQATAGSASHLPTAASSMPKSASMQ